MCLGFDLAPSRAQSDEAPGSQKPDHTERRDKERSAPGARHGCGHRLTIDDGADHPVTRDAQRACVDPAARDYIDSIRERLAAVLVDRGRRNEWRSAAALIQELKRHDELLPGDDGNAE
jgi:hypothetical protein